MSESVRMLALQATMVRLTVDPAFGERLYSGDPGARTIDVADGPYHLTDADLALFQAVDPRAWTTDRYRRTRLVQALVQEYAVTTAILGVARLDAFFRTPAFAHVLGHHGSMAEAFGVWAAASVRGSVSAIVQLEAAICQSRRSHRPSGAGFVATPGMEGVRLPQGTLAAWQDGRAALGADPVAAAAQGVRWQPPSLPHTFEHLLIDGTGDEGVGVHFLSAGVVGLLAFCRTPRSHADIGRHARTLRIPRKAVSKTLREMQAEGLLIERSS